MDMPSVVEAPVQEHEQLCQQQCSQMLMWLAVIAATVLLVLYIDLEVIALSAISVEFLLLALVAALPLLLIVGLKTWKFFSSKGKLNAYQLIQSKLEQSLYDSSPETIQKVLSEAKVEAKANHLIPALFEHYQPLLKERLTTLHRQRLQKSLDEECNSLELSCNSKVDELYKQVPLIKANNQIETSLDFLTNRREEMHEQWETDYESFSWWNKLKYSDGLDFSDLDTTISELTNLQKTMATKHAADFKTLDLHFEHLKQRALARMSAAKVKAEQFIQDGHYQDNADASMFNKALWLAAMSVPVSVWADVDSAMNVYDTLRGVNGNFADMSDAEIWWESLLMPAESLAGLAALTKGAYFEQLVAVDTGGQLHEHFNHPDTDIVIDGIDFQIKATDSVAYISSVDESIPVISTTEVALATGAIDSGYGNEELTRIVDDAIGGTVVDIGDTAVDAILAGLGGLGLFATIEGINQASKMHANGGDAVEAVFKGVCVAVEGTAKALVGAAEMVYNVLASRPSRFLGRTLRSLGETLLKGLEKLDQKLFDEPDRK